MENFSNMFNCSNKAWDLWQFNTSKFDWSENITTTTGGGGATHLESNSGDPHFICLNLGKRHYFEDSTTTTTTTPLTMSKKGKPYCGGGAATSSAAPVPACQVEGCGVELVNAKEYYKRHKVCEMHSKALKVVVMGLEQRFCQQCSRFHGVVKFDDAKRSCRRRLAGHNERRRKNSNDSITKYPSQGCAHSLLSSKSDTWVSPVDLSLRSSAALRDLIAENRAAIMAKQMAVERDWQLHHNTMQDLGHDPQPRTNSLLPNQNQMLLESQSWDQIYESGTHLTLDLMQGRNSGYDLLSARGKPKENEDCNELWNTLEGAHLV